MILNLLCCKNNTICCFIVLSITVICLTIIIFYGVVAIIKASKSCNEKNIEKAYIRLIEYLYNKLNIKIDNTDTVQSSKAENTKPTKNKKK